MVRGLGAPLAVAALLALPGCSLLYLDLEPGDCASFDECDPLNDRDGLDALSCEQWTCDVREHVCIRRPIDRDGDGALGPWPGRTTCDYEPTDCDDRDPTRAPDLIEECDGRDNDCDAVIDDVVDPMATTLPVEEGSPIGPVMPGVSGALDITFPSSQSASARTSVVAGRDGDLVASAIDLSAPSAVSSLAWATYCASATRAPGCAADRLCSSGLRVCDAGEPTVDPVGGLTWLGVVNTGQCAGGEIRVGVLEGGEIVANANDEGPGFPSCGEGPARAPSLAGLDDRTALLTHLAEPFGTRTCGGSRAVGAAILTLDSAPRTGDVTSTGTVDLGMTSGSSSAAVLAIPEASAWLVAFASDSGGVALRWVGADGSVQALAALGAGQVDSVRVSGGVVGGSVRLGVVWQAGCDHGAIQFASVSVPVAAPGGAVSTPPVTLGADGRAPAVVWRSQGLVEAGYTRGGIVAGDADRGGWYVAWSGSAGTEGVVMQRVLQLDGQPITVTSVEPHPAIPPLRILDQGVSALWLARASGDRPVDLYAFGEDRLVRRARVWCGAAGAP